MESKYAALFVREDSAYKKRDVFDCYDINRDALNYDGDMPVVCHPPCRAWGALSHMANPRDGEKELALFALDTVRRVGGILEHPSGSRIRALLPDVNGFADEFGGFTILIDQWDFGHVARKKTLLYICGIDIAQFPSLPKKREGVPVRSIAGNVPNTTRCTQYQREYTPEKLIDFFENILAIISDNRKGIKN